MEQVTDEFAFVAMCSVPCHVMTLLYFLVMLSNLYLRCCTKNCPAQLCTDVHYRNIISLRGDHKHIALPDRQQEVVVVAAECKKAVSETLEASIILNSTKVKEAITHLSILDWT